MAAALMSPNTTSIDAGTDSRTYSSPAVTWTNGKVAAAQKATPSTSTSRRPSAQPSGSNSRPGTIACLMLEATAGCIKGVR